MKFSKVISAVQNIWSEPRRTVVVSYLVVECVKSEIDREVKMLKEVFYIHQHLSTENLAYKRMYRGNLQICSSCRNQRRGDGRVAMSENKSVLAQR